jgi:uncharacterized protein YfaP (DUF2135 family)
MRSFILLLIGLACAPALWAAPSAELSEPVGGWRYHGLLDRSENPQVAYPTPPIDRGIQRNRTMIQGQLKAIGQSCVRRTARGQRQSAESVHRRPGPFRPALCVRRRFQQRRSAQRRRPVAQARAIL